MCIEKYVRVSNTVIIEYNAQVMKTNTSLKELIILADITNRNEDQVGKKIIQDLGRFVPDRVCKYLAENALCLSN